MTLIVSIICLTIVLVTLIVAGCAMRLAEEREITRIVMQRHREMLCEGSTLDSLPPLPPNVHVVDMLNRDVNRDA